MPGSPVQRKLAAILVADVVGYSRLMGANEEGALARLRALRGDLIEPAIARHQGRIVKSMGNGLLVEFVSAVDAVHCAVEWQRRMDTEEAPLPPEQRICFRIGINLGDVIVEGDDLYGDGVNIAAGLQEVAAPGSVAVSSSVHDNAAARNVVAFDDRGAHRLKNIARPSACSAGLRDLLVQRHRQGEARTQTARLAGATPTPCDGRRPKARPDPPRSRIRP